MKSWLVQRGSGIRAEASGIIAGNLLSNMASNRVQIRPIRKPKRFRSAFTTEQVNYLEQKFKKFPYISSEHRKEIAASLNMQERAIKIWFQNRRMKEKKETINKELNDDINQAEEFSKYQLNNLCTLQSTNEQLSYSLPTITKPERVESTYFRKINTVRVHYDDDNLGNTNLLSMNVNQNHNKKSTINVPIAPIKQQEKVPMKGKIQPSCKPAECKMEITIGSCKKEKEVKDSIVRHNMEQEDSKKLEVGRLTCSSKARKAPVDCSSNKVQHTPQGPQKFGNPHQITSNPSKKAEISGPTYFPVVPTIYAHPFISGGMIWKPVSVVPVMSQPAFSGPSNSHEHFGHDQKSICSCNCHGNVHPVAVHPGPINPYAQYVITTPLQNTSPNL